MSVCLSYGCNSNEWAKVVGRFLLARLHLVPLRSMTSLRKLESSLETFPEDLDGTYNQVLYRVRIQSEDFRALALKTFA